jgi:hypothetical protein
VPIAGRETGDGFASGEESYCLSEKNAGHGAACRANEERKASDANIASNAIFGERRTGRI